MLQDKKQLGSALNTIAYGQAMLAAARDYAKVSAPKKTLNCVMACKQSQLAQGSNQTNL
jgi:hypothetical protein